MMSEKAQEDTEHEYGWLYRNWVSDGGKDFDKGETRRRPRGDKRCHVIATVPFFRLRSSYPRNVLLYLY